ncbi:unnamed protein product [Miscanthus lutarioriparius]|uniref:Uncharacterized protein n=1 Tax=Miscanthus lutarioriparius TaxID=422564 RepID=A0A811R339_9POAL|nr:unnamed protein product [Miscanthus lutarioriparius]
MLREFKHTFVRRTKARLESNPDAEDTTEGAASPLIPPAAQEVVVTARDTNEEGDTSTESDHIDDDDYVIQHRPDKGLAKPEDEDNSDHDDDANDYEEEVETDLGGTQRTQDDITPLRLSSLESHMDLPIGQR